MPTALIVSGPPCAGKSTLARHLRESLGWPLLAKDAFKETLYETLGWGDRAWSKRLSLASYAVMFASARELSAAGRSYILEGNFRWSENETNFASLADVRETRFVQLYCTAPVDVLIERWRIRSSRRERHPGHLDTETAAEMEVELRSRFPEPLPIGETTLRVDSSLPVETQVGEAIALLRRLEPPST